MNQPTNRAEPGADTALEAATKTVELIRSSRGSYATPDEWRLEMTKAVREMERLAKSQPGYESVDFSKRCPECGRIGCDGGEQDCAAFRRTCAVCRYCERRHASDWYCYQTVMHYWRESSSDTSK